MQRKRSNYTRGFSLIELAVVLVVIGLVTGAVISGITILHQSDLRSVIRNAEGYHTAVVTFAQEYTGLPGDLYNASILWPSSGTENGSGDRQIVYNTGAGDNEALYAWQHMMLAGLITGNFPGVGEGTGQEAVPGVNIPTLSINGTSAGFYIDYVAWHSRPSRNTIILGAQRENNANATSILSPADAESIDRKIDDGGAGTGFMMTSEGRNTADTAWSSDCISGSGAAATYQLAVTSQECIIGFYVE